jgi:alkanesulfonate monooxygenase SsuD/methylene tetrahydromethanopterin reductase-like flavin-dependent oxidoreductase (luciferase family)
LETFLDFFWIMLWFFAWVIWIMLLFRVFADIFRTDQSGWAKAGWTLFVLVLPFLGVLVYLIAQGGNMADREWASMREKAEIERSYIRSIAGSPDSTADELEKLASLRDRGVISDAEFQAQKEKVIGTPPQIDKVPA